MTKNSIKNQDRMWINQSKSIINQSSSNEWIESINHQSIRREWMNELSNEWMNYRINHQSINRIESNESNQSIINQSSINHQSIKINRNQILCALASYNRTSEVIMTPAIHVSFLELAFKILLDWTKWLGLFITHSFPNEKTNTKQQNLTTYYCATYYRIRSSNIITRLYKVKRQIDMTRLSTIA